METKMKFWRHSLPIMMIVFPLGLLTTAVVCDLIHFYSSDTLWAQFSFLLIFLGGAVGAAAAIVGWTDWFNLPNGTRARRIGILRGVGNAAVLVLFAVSWWLRSKNIQNPGALAYGLSFIGIALAAVTSWLGGEPVERMEVAVHPNANVDAPSSLSKDIVNETQLAAKSDDSHQAA